MPLCVHIHMSDMYMPLYMFLHVCARAVEDLTYICTYACLRKCMLSCMDMSHVTCPCHTCMPCAFAEVGVCMRCASAQVRVRLQNNEWVKLTPSDVIEEGTGDIFCEESIQAGSSPPLLLSSSPLFLPQLGIG